MSFIQNDSSARSFAPGFFLANDDENCVRLTREIPQTLATTLSDGRKIVKAGTFFPANSSGTVEGIVYEDIDVTSGNTPGSVVLKGTVYLDRLPASPESGVQSALEGKGFKFIAADPIVKRPQWKTNGSLDELSVTSGAGTASGDTKITVTGHSFAQGEKYWYKVATGTAPFAYYGMTLDATWTDWDGTSDITAATGKKITVVVADSIKEVTAAGSATVTAHA